MIKKIPLTFMASFLMIFPILTAAANHETHFSQNALQMSTIITNIQAKGYHDIRKIELHHGLYKIEAVNAQGKENKLYVYPQTSAIKKTQKEHDIHLIPAKVSMLDTVKKLEQAGYHAIDKIALKGEVFKVKAFDKNNKKVKLKVNINNGEISED